MVPRDLRTSTLEQSPPLVFLSGDGVCVCVCVHRVSWHVCDMRMFMAWGAGGELRRLVGGEKGRATDREGRGGPARKTG